MHIKIPYEKEFGQGGDTPYTKARRFLSTCERGHLGLRSIARVNILWEKYLNLQRK